MMHAGFGRLLILPDGQITSCFARLPVQPLLQKYFVSGLTQITSKSLIVLSHRGAFRDRHGRWERDAVDAAALGAHERLQGGFSRERSQACWTKDAEADGEVVWF